MLSVDTKIARLISELNSLCTFLESKYCINQGGCCFVAYEIARHLDKLNIKYDLVISDYDIRNERNITKEIRNKRKNKNYFDSVVGDYTCNHYYLYDKNCGFINPDIIANNNYYFISDLNYKHIKWIYDKSRWNDCFNLEDKNYVKSFIKIFFESCLNQL